MVNESSIWKALTLTAAAWCRKPSLSVKQTGAWHFGSNDLLTEAPFSGTAFCFCRFFQLIVEILQRTLSFFIFWYFFETWEKKLRVEKKKKLPPKKTPQVCRRFNSWPSGAVRTTWSCQHSKLLSWQWTGGQVETPLPPPTSPTPQPPSQHSAWCVCCSGSWDSLYPSPITSAVNTVQSLNMR